MKGGGTEAQLVSVTADGPSSAYSPTASQFANAQMNHPPPYDGGTPLVVPRALEHDLSLVAAQSVTVRRRSAQPAPVGGLNPATGGATGGVWPPPASQKRMRLSPSESLDDLAKWIPGADARAAMEAMSQFPQRMNESPAERPEGMVNTYEVRAFFVLTLWR